MFILLKQHAFDPDSNTEVFDGEINIDLKKKSENIKKIAPRRSNFSTLRNIVSKIEPGSKKQIDAIHAMYIKIETEIEDLKEKAKEKDYATEMVEQSALEIAQGKKPGNINLRGVKERDIHRIMNVEFMGMKQLIGKHQMTLNRVEKCLRDLEEYKNQNNYGKLID